jgi:hypothetical protein
LAEQPRGWRVRSKRAGDHVVRIAFPPGRRKRGSGKVLEVLHPKKNPSCEEGSCRESNPAELVIFTNPAKVSKKQRGSNGGTNNHKPKCKCPFCKRARGENPKSKTTPKVKSTRAGRARRKARPHRRNPDQTEQAVKLFEIFHGKDAREISEKHVSAAMRKDYSALGKLIAIGTDDCGWGEKAIVQKWDQCPHINFSEDHVTLASSPDGRQLYAIGGNQNLNGCLSKFEGVDPTKDFIDLGEIAFVVYEARKIHSNFEPTEWVHKFGGKGNVRPAWMFDRLKKQIFFIGGEYFIDMKAEISPGIEG